MKTVSAILLCLTLISGIYTTGCDVHHTETDKPNLLGGHTHEEQTTVTNPVTGDTSTSKTEQKTP